MLKPENFYISFCAYAVNFMNVRVHHPVDALRMLGANVAVYQKEIGLPPDAPENAVRVMVLQRAFLSKDAWPALVKKAIKQDWLLVVEYDDYPENPFNAAKRANSLDWERFRMCHGVQTSTSDLQSVFFDYNDYVGLFENHLFRMPPPINRHNKAVRVFFGALNRKDAWKPLVSSYNRVLKSHPNLQPVVLHDKEFFDALETDRKVFQPSCSYEKYLQILHSCDISLQPLNDSVFNRYKSDIKFVEAAAGGLAVLASPTVYEKTIKHGDTGLIADKPRAWEEAFSRLASDSGLRKQLGANAKEYVMRDRMLIDHIRERLTWYGQLWDKREQINQRLLETYPELAD